MDIRIIKKLHECIMTEQTGSPKELSNKLGVSERTIYNYISFMKVEMNAPIIYDNQKGNYIYERVCLLVFKG
ncbi:HTH domain-containing protein [Flavobacterium sp.]|uniref:HTH domain-containing protein n=1 Tax=Flavobacterium sp. TaxID=239 RepID=UPI00286E958C|nr:HTH domain-containing protein [Flavobacterium sp.]